MYGVLNRDGTMDRNKIVRITQRPSTQQEKNALWMMDPLNTIDEEIVPATPPKLWTRVMTYSEFVDAIRSDAPFRIPESPPPQATSPRTPPPVSEIIPETPPRTPPPVSEIIPETPPGSHTSHTRSGTTYNPRSILSTATGPIPIPLANRNRSRAHTTVCRCLCPIACNC